MAALSIQRSKYAGLSRDHPCPIHSRILAKGWDIKSLSNPLSTQHEKWVPHISILRCGIARTQTRLQVSTNAPCPILSRSWRKGGKPTALGPLSLELPEIASRSDFRRIKRMLRGNTVVFLDGHAASDPREGTGTEPIAMSSYVRFIPKGSRICGVQKLLIASALLLVAPDWAHAQAAATPIRIDASQSWREPGPARYDEGSASTPAGRTVGLNSRFLTLDGKPWLPVVGRISLFALPARPVGRRNPQDEGRRRQCRLHLRDLDSSRGDPGPVRLDGSARPARLRPALRQTSACI